MEIGIDSFAARFDDAGLAASPVDRMRELLERIELADQVGLDVFDSCPASKASSQNVLIAATLRVEDETGSRSNAIGRLTAW